MAGISLPGGFDRLRRLDPALADRLGEDFTRLAQTSTALAWAHGQLPSMVAATSERALLSVVVERARELTGAPITWAVSWLGDLPSGRASYAAMAGDGATLDSPPALSRTILGRVVERGQPAWTDDAEQDARFRAAESVQAARLRSVGCVPLGRCGVLWLEDPDAPGRFSPAQRLRLSALCVLAGQLLGARRQRPPPPSQDLPFQAVPGIVGSAPCMQALAAAIHAFAPMPWPALVLGETGTGKEAVAHALHQLSDRASHPFVAVNCGTLVDSLAESTLFGHERGAFTGADRRQPGVVERVGRGTLFLDEVGELSPAVQVKLLRLLQEGVYERVGGRQVERFAGRVVAATHRPLDDEDARGLFREDLYYRLAACIIRVPPLRDRRSDIPALCRHLLHRATDELHLDATLSLSDDAVQELCERSWPGNVRQLDNSLRRACALTLARGQHTVTREDLGGWVPPVAATAPPAANIEGAAAASTDTGSPTTPDAPAATSAPDAIDPSLDLKQATLAFQQARVQAALTACGGNRSEAARRLGVSRQWLHRLITRFEQTP